MPEPQKYSKIRLRPSVAAEPDKAEAPKSPAKYVKTKLTAQSEPAPPSLGPLGAAGTPTVTVETGSGTNPNANSYISITDAQTYHDNSLYAAEWHNATSLQQKQAVVTATRIIDASCAFRGYRKLTSQPLAWPRVLAKNDEYCAGYYNPLMTSLPYYDENSLPRVLVEATAVVALEVLRSDRTADAGSKGITDLSLGSGALSLSLDASNAPKPLPDETLRMLSGLVRSFRGYGSATKRVVRTL